MNDSDPDPLAARVHALIAQWRSDAESALYNARVFMVNAIEEEWYESRAMGRAQTYKECAFDLEAALAAALAPKPDDGGVAETARRHSAACRAQEAQRQREADALQAEWAGGAPSDAPTRDFSKWARLIVEQVHDIYQNGQSEGLSAVDIVALTLAEIFPAPLYGQPAAGLAPHPARHEEP